MNAGKGDLLVIFFYSSPTLCDPPSPLQSICEPILHSHFKRIFPQTHMRAAKRGMSNIPTIIIPDIALKPYIIQRCMQGCHRRIVESVLACIPVATHTVGPAAGVRLFFLSPGLMALCMISPPCPLRNTMKPLSRISANPFRVLRVCPTNPCRRPTRMTCTCWQNDQNDQNAPTRMTSTCWQNDQNDQNAPTRLTCTCCQNATRTTSTCWQNDQNAPARAGHSGHSGGRAMPILAILVNIDSHCGACNHPPTSPWMVARPFGGTNPAHLFMVKRRRPYKRLSTCPQANTTARNGPGQMLATTVS